MAHKLPDAQRVWDVRPAVTSGNGVSAQAQRAQRTPDSRPHAARKPGGMGVSAQRTTRPDLVEWFRAIQERLKGVIVLNRSWESALTPTLLMHTPTAPKPPVGILLDPPYLTVDRQSELYGSDADGSSSDVATAAYQWALANGERFRIAYCCHEGDFPVPGRVDVYHGVIWRGQGRGAAGSAAGHGDVFANVRTGGSRPADAIAVKPLLSMGGLKWACN